MSFSKLILMLSMVFVMFNPSIYATQDPIFAPKEEFAKLPPKEARQFQNKVKRLEWERSEAHKKLKAQGGTTKQHKAIDDASLNRARQLESKRTKALKNLAKKAGISDIKQGSYGTDPSKGRGAFGDIDTADFSGKNFDKIRKTAKKMGYTVTTDGDTMHIKELDTTVHRKSSKYKSKLGSSAGESGAASGYGKESSRSIKTGDKTTKVLDNLGKSGHTLDIPPNKMSSSDWQEMGKMTGRNMDATGLKDRKFRKQLEGLKKGYHPDSLGIDNPEAFQKKCRDMNTRATKRARLGAKVKEQGLEKKLSQNNKDIDKAKQSGNKKKIREATNKAKQTQKELKKHRQTQNAAEDSLKKNQPKRAEQILEDTKPTKTDVENKVKQQDLQKRLDRANTDIKKAQKSGDQNKLKEAKKRAEQTKKELKHTKRVQNNTQKKPTSKNIKSKRPKQKISSSGKKGYMKVTKNLLTGGVEGITIFSTAQDLKEKLVKGDYKGAAEFIADGATGGAISITKQNVTKLKDYHNTKKQIDYANRTEYEAYILRAGKALRENGVSRKETEQIMSAMRKENLSSYKSKLAILKKEGKHIQVKPPKLIARSWHSFFTDGDEELSTRAADIFIAIGDGIIAMPGKAKKFLSGANSDLYEIFGGIEINRDGSIDINKGIFEKGVIAELFNQKVESANNVLDIAKNTYRAYEINKEIEEQKERKDKFKLQEDLRNSLIKQGYSFDEANEISKKAAHNNDWSGYRNARKNVKANKTAKKFADEMGIYPEDFLKFANCMCQGCGGSLGGSFNPNFKCDIGYGPCKCSGPLTTWKTPLPTQRKEALECINYIAKEHYENNQKIFDKWHQNILNANAKSVQIELTKVHELAQNPETLDKATQLFLTIKPLLYPKDAHTIKEIIAPKLATRAQESIQKGKLDHAIKDLKLEKEVSGFPNKNSRDIKQAEYWLKSWEEAKKNIFPKIRNYLQSGQLEEVKKILGNKLHWQMQSRSYGESHYPPAFKDKDYLALMKAYEGKIQERDKDIKDTYAKARKYSQASDQKSAIKSLNDLLHRWQHSDYSAKKIVKKRANPYAENLANAKIAAHQGDASKGRKNLKAAIQEYSSSLRIQKDALVQRKLDELIKQISVSKERLQKGRELWKNGELQQAIAKVENAQKITDQDWEINKTLKSMQHQKKMIDNALKKADKLIEQKKFKQAKSVLRKAGRISSKYPPYAEMLNKMDSAKREADKVKKILADAKQQWKKDKSQSPISKLDEVLKIDPNHPEAQKLKKEWQDIVLKKEIERKKELAHQEALKEEAERAERLKKERIAQKAREITAKAEERENERRIAEEKALKEAQKRAEEAKLKKEEMAQRIRKAMKKAQEREQEAERIAAEKKVNTIKGGITKSSSSYVPNIKGDVFNGGHWASSQGGSAWVEKIFDEPKLITGVHIGRASTDVTTKGFRLVLKLKKPNGEWITIDELHDSNINRTALSGGAIGKSIPSYSKGLSPAIKTTAFRLEFSGHGWFDATDIRIYSETPINNESDSINSKIGISVLATYSIGLNEWFDTGIDLKKGSLLSINAKGTWRLGSGARKCDADGLSNFPPYRGYLYGTLMGKIGRNGVVFPVGKRYKVRSNTTGRLYLGNNDSDKGNNSGSIDITIDVK